MHLEDQVGIEVKSNNKVLGPQLRKDEEMVSAGWAVHYVFGSEPSAHTVARLAEAGVTYEVFHSVPVSRR